MKFSVICLMPLELFDCIFIASLKRVCLRQDAVVSHVQEVVKNDPDASIVVHKWHPAAENRTAPP